MEDSSTAFIDEVLLDRIPGSGTAARAVQVNRGFGVAGGGIELYGVVIAADIYRVEDLRGFRVIVEVFVLTFWAVCAVH